MADPADSGSATIRASIVSALSSAISRSRKWHERTVFDETRSNAGECPAPVFSLQATLEPSARGFAHQPQEADMPVYMIADIKVTDGRWVPEYAASVHKLVHKHGGKYLARSGNVRTL